MYVRKDESDHVGVDRDVDGVGASRDGDSFGVLEPPSESCPCPPETSGIGVSD